MIILITGASHTGKTLLAQRLLEKYQYPCMSMDHLKMGLIRSGNTSLTPEDDEELVSYLWPIVREMIKTAVENRQNLIVEGCYIPPDWKEDFSERYLKEIRFCCLVMSRRYIEQHFDDIKEHAGVIECRMDDAGFTMEMAVKDNARYLKMCEEKGLPYTLIDGEYKMEIGLLSGERKERPDRPPEGEKLNQKERMLANLPYKAWLDGLSEERLENKKRIYRYNNLPPEKEKEQAELIRQIIGKHGENLVIEPPFHCDYGSNIEVGENFFANYNLTILDVGKVKIGKNAQIAPNVSIYTAGHPVHPDSRNSGYEYGIDITIGDNVWIGGSSVINPGVTIGNNVVIGSGSVVTKDLPDNVIAAGNPCRVIRSITEEDRKFYFKNREFDVEDYR